MATTRHNGSVRTRALSDSRSLVKDKYSPAAPISPLAAAQNTALRIGILHYPFDPATAGQELLDGFGFCRLASGKARRLGALIDIEVSYRFE
jgi:hypothetical protein